MMAVPFFITPPSCHPEPVRNEVPRRIEGSPARRAAQDDRHAGDNRSDAGSGGQLHATTVGADLEECPPGGCEAHAIAALRTAGQTQRRLLPIGTTLAEGGVTP